MKRKRAGLDHDLVPVGLDDGEPALGPGLTFLRHHLHTMCLISYNTLFCDRAAFFA